MMAMERCSSGAAGPILLKTTICTRGHLCCSITTVEHDGTQCQKKYEAEVHFH
jgi:hypothetical protein